MESQRIIVYGTTWCGECRRAKLVLDEAGADYEWIDIDQVPEAAERVVQLSAGFRSVPTIVLPDGQVLVEPGRHELLEALARH